MAESTVHFNRPRLSEEAWRFMREAVDNLEISGDGAFTKKCQRHFEETLGVRKALLTTSCTHALEMAALLLDIQPGDEVIVPSFTFVSTANAFVLRGAKPVFADVRPDTLNMDEKLLPALITKRTKAIVPVHYAGVACEMDAINQLADRHGIAVVEDNAHGLFGSYNGRPLGSLGRMATLSFHQTKNITCGEGGALLLNDPGLVQRAEILREKGTNRNRFFRGEVDKYTWVDAGSSYVPADILAAILWSQLREADAIQERRRRIHETYRDGLADWAVERGYGVPAAPPGCAPAYHLFHLLAPSLEERTALIRHLKDNGVNTVFHYVPLHLSEMGRKFGGRPGDCPVTEHAGDCLVRLPFHNSLTDMDLARVLRAIRRFPGVRTAFSRAA